MQDFVSILQFGGAVTAFFMAMATFLVARKHDRADLLLAWVLLLIGVVLLRTGISVSRLIAQYPHQLGVLFPLTYLIGPLLLFYSRAKLKDQHFRWLRFWPHALPAIGSYLMLVPVFLLSLEEKQAYIALTFQPRLLQSAFEMFSFSAAANLLQLFIVWLVLAAYTLFSLRIAHSLPGEPLNSRQHTTRHWVSFLSLGLMVASLLALGSMVIIFIFNVVFLSSLLMMAYLSFVVITGYSAMQLVLRPEMLHPEPEDVYSGDKALSANQKPQVKKYENSGLSREDAKMLAIRLRRIVKEEQLYRLHDLTLRTLAEHLGCTSKHLSQVLNEVLRENFYEFINRHRVDEITQQLKRGVRAEKPIIDIAFDAGFNSKPAFYNAFRKTTGMTPTEYSKQFA